MNKHKNGVQQLALLIYYWLPALLILRKEFLSYGQNKLKSNLDRGCGKFQNFTEILKLYLPKKKLSQIFHKINNKLTKTTNAEERKGVKFSYDKRKEKRSN